MPGAGKDPWDLPSSRLCVVAGVPSGSEVNRTRYETFGVGVASRAPWWHLADAVSVTRFRLTPPRRGRATPGPPTPFATGRPDVTRSAAPWSTPGGPLPGPRPRRGRDPPRQGHRPAPATFAQVRYQPGLLHRRDLVAWLQLIGLDGRLAEAEPKRLRDPDPAHRRPPRARPTSPLATHRLQLALGRADPPPRCTGSRRPAPRADQPRRCPNNPEDPGDHVRRCDRRPCHHARSLPTSTISAQVRRAERADVRRELSRLVVCIELFSWRGGSTVA
ncbi:hypothetical protein JD77_05842 [Micromonospora olivasterospora]|uniref:Uncharacterized protein n=1 Tax=Micromonospora olivasterospora TaxID=1880 RepID=A0A562IIG3_MICOL|nr:hypothetical protein JD77_05842 [Micromonospora olivasterospora]